MKYIVCIIIFFISTEITAQPVASNSSTNPYIVILGTLQDGGSPHIGCEKDCCKNIDPNKKVVSLGIIDPSHNKKFLVEATPDISTQLAALKKTTPLSNISTPDGIFITHAHIGHYAGLMQLGREAMNSKGVKVFAMPIMKTFLESNGPWNQLIALHNIEISPIQNDHWETITPSLKVKALKVPHRDEYSETVGYIIEGPHKKVLFIPDIDKWEKWNTSIVDLIKEIDIALIDGTFFSNEEVAYRKIEEIPHPLVSESIKLFEQLSMKDKNKIHFIHLNHTNPLLKEHSKEHMLLTSKGFHVAAINMKIDL